MSGKNNKNIKYKCSNCGAETLKWMGRCPQCGEWNTLEEKIEVSAPKNIRIRLWIKFIQILWKLSVKWKTL